MSSASVTFFKPMAIFFCTNGPIDSSSSSSSFAESYRRRWSNPLRRRRLDQPPEIVRHWVEAEANHSLPPQERVMVVSYNILGDRNAFKHRDLYQNVPSIYMTWGYRKRIICKELIGWNADIICLQNLKVFANFG
ncbi:unnamed protein product [Ilex paraguariensis]|uniref:Endonuclease/exonuclease/phosphatase domain-containing protein n=1 Tax=Ilex paraguariensis TaxID=185542 RepID=A0ABC8UZV4_9AQUA